MPNKDRTGPNGKWVWTGRWAWNCESKRNCDNENLGRKNGQWCRQWRWRGNGVKRCCEKW